MNVLHERVSRAGALGRLAAIIDRLSAGSALDKTEADWLSGFLEPVRDDGPRFLSSFAGRSWTERGAMTQVVMESAEGGDSAKLLGQIQKLYKELRRSPVKLNKTQRQFALDVAKRLRRHFLAAEPFTSATSRNQLTTV